MIELCFGLPGTGKSTFAKQHKYHMSFDLGHNSFKSNEAREKFYRKAQKATAGILDCYSNVKVVYWDTYPEYFDLTEVGKHINDIHITFALPFDDIDMVIERVGTRDGKDSEFYKLYQKEGHKWLEEWKVIYSMWYKRFGKAKVTLISRYDA